MFLLVEAEILHKATFLVVYNNTLVASSVRPALFGVFGHQYVFAEYMELSRVPLL